MQFVYFTKLAPNLWCAHSLPASEIARANHADIAYCRQILNEMKQAAPQRS